MTRDEELLMNFLDYHSKYYPNWFVDAVKYVISHGKGGSIRGWSCEDAISNGFQKTCEKGCEYIITNYESTEPNSDLGITHVLDNNNFDLQIKCYRISQSSGSQVATLPGINLCENLKDCILSGGSFDGPRFSEIVTGYKLPVDLLIKLDDANKKATLYVFDFVPLLSKVTKISETKGGISLFAYNEKKNREMVAFRINYQKTATNSWNRGIWISDWFLEENVRPLACIDYPEPKNVYYAFIAT